MFLELNSKRLYQSSGKEKESRCLVLTSTAKREIRHFHVASGSKGKERYEKAGRTYKVVVLSI